MISKYSPDVIKFLFAKTRPHVITENISKLNFEAMKEAGMEKVIFNKYNTLVEGGEWKMKKQNRFALENAKKTFGAENVFIVSNTHER